MKKIINKRLFLSRSIFFFICLGFLNLPGSAGTKPYSFKNNNEADTAKDLHIVFNNGVSHNVATQQDPAGTFSGMHNGSGSTIIGLGDGVGVLPGASVTLTFTYGGNTPQVKKWWWTKNGEAEDDTKENRLGNVKTPRKGVYKFAIVPSTGDGMIEVTIDGEGHIFEMLAGVSGDEMAGLFAGFIEGLTWGEVQSVEGSSVIMFSTALSEEVDDFTVNIIPDSTQEVTFNYIPMVIPTLSQWGVIILILLVLAVGMVFLYQRQTSLAMAGVAEVSSARQKLFDGKIFLKIFAIVLLVGIVGLTATFWYYGQVTNADPFGVFVSAGVVAYMVHLWMLREKEGRK